MRTLVTLSSGGFKPSCCCCWSSNNFFFLACFSRRATAWTPDAMVPSRLLCPVSQPSDVFWQPEDEPNTLLSTSVLHTTTSSRVEDLDHGQHNTAERLSDAAIWCRESAQLASILAHAIAGRHKWKRREIKRGVHRSLRWVFRGQIPFCFSMPAQNNFAERVYIHNSKPRLRPP